MDRVREGGVKEMRAENPSLVKLLFGSMLLAEK